jgi:hypothetical protein
MQPIIYFNSMKHDCNRKLILMIKGLLYISPVYFYVLKMFLKKIKIFYFILLQINIFLVFLYYFDMLISKIIF